MLTVKPLSFVEPDPVTEATNDVFRPEAIPMPLPSSTDLGGDSPGHVSQMDLDRLADDGNPHGQHHDAN